MEQAPAVPCPRRRGLLAKYSGASLIGFALSAAVMHLGLLAGMAPWSARLAGMECAMNLTFLINGRFVFRALTRRWFFAQWAAYMANSGLGNACNYLVFVALEWMHRPLISNPDVAFVSGAMVAWTINFTGARFVVFGDGGARLVALCRRVFVSPRARRSAPEPGEPGSSPR